MMLKKILLTSATITSCGLGIFGTPTHANQEHVTYTKPDREKVNVIGIDDAVKSLSDVNSIQLSASKSHQPERTQQLTAEASVKQNEAKAEPAPAVQTQTLNHIDMNEQQVAVEPKTNDQLSVPSSQSANVVATAAPKPVTNTGDIQWLITRESHGDAHATNGVYYGIGQLAESYYDKYVPGQNYRGNYDVQLEAMQKYIAERYGTVDNAISHWQSNNWY